MKIYVGKSLNEFQTSLQLVGMSEIQARKSLLRLYFSGYLPARTECNYKSEAFLLLCAKRRVLERNLCVQWFPHFSFSCLLISGYSWMLTYTKKTTMAISLKSWKIDNVDLTQQFSLSIFTDFRYQSIKITWLLPILIYWLLREYTTHVSI